MPKILTIGTENFEIPLQGENGDYGEQLTDFFEAVSNALSTVQQPNDVTVQTAIILNNQATFADISGFIFDSSQVISINAEGIIKRSTVSPAVSLVEDVIIRGNFNGSSWVYSVISQGNAGIEFNITDAGQLQYKTSSITGTSYSGAITFRGKVFNS